MAPSSSLSKLLEPVSSYPLSKENKSSLTPTLKALAQLLPKLERAEPPVAVAREIGELFSKNATDLYIHVGLAALALAEGVLRRLWDLARAEPSFTSSSDDSEDGASSEGLPPGGEWESAVTMGVLTSFEDYLNDNEHKPDLSLFAGRLYAILVSILRFVPSDDAEEYKLSPLGRAKIAIILNQTLAGSPANKLLLRSDGFLPDTVLGDLIGSADDPDLLIALLEIALRTMKPPRKNASEDEARRDRAERRAACETIFRAADAPHLANAFLDVTVTSWAEDMDNILGGIAKIDLSRIQLFHALKVVAGSIDLHETYGMDKDTPLRVFFTPQSIVIHTAEEQDRLEVPLNRREVGQISMRHGDTSDMFVLKMLLKQSPLRYGERHPDVPAGSTVRIVLPHTEKTRLKDLLFFLGWMNPTRSRAVPQEGPKAARPPSVVRGIEVQVPTPPGARMQFQSQLSQPLASSQPVFEPPRSGKSTPARPARAEGPGTSRKRREKEVENIYNTDGRSEPPDAEDFDNGGRRDDAVKLGYASRLTVPSPGHTACPSPKARAPSSPKGVTHWQPPVRAPPLARQSSAVRAVLGGSEDDSALSSPPPGPAQQTTSGQEPVEQPSAARPTRASAKKRKSSDAVEPADQVEADAAASASKKRKISKPSSPPQDAVEPKKTPARNKQRYGKSAARLSARRGRAGKGTSEAGTEDKNDQVDFDAIPGASAADQVRASSRSSTGKKRTAAMQSRKNAKSASAPSDDEFDVLPQPAMSAASTDGKDKGKGAAQSKPPPSKKSKTKKDDASPSATPLAKRATRASKKAELASMNAESSAPVGDEPPLNRKLRSTKQDTLGPADTDERETFLPPPPPVRKTPVKQKDEKAGAGSASRAMLAGELEAEALPRGSRSGDEEGKQGKQLLMDDDNNHLSALSVASSPSPSPSSRPPFIFGQVPAVVVQPPTQEASRASLGSRTSRSAERWQTEDIAGRRTEGSGGQGQRREGLKTTEPRPAPQPAASTSKRRATAETPAPKPSVAPAETKSATKTFRLPWLAKDYAQPQEPVDAEMSEPAAAVLEVEQYENPFDAETYEADVPDSLPLVRADKQVHNPIHTGTPSIKRRETSKKSADADDASPPVAPAPIPPTHQTPTVPPLSHSTSKAPKPSKARSPAPEKPMVSSEKDKSRADVPAPAMVPLSKLATPSLVGQRLPYGTASGGSARHEKPAAPSREPDADADMDLGFEGGADGKFAVEGAPLAGHRPADPEATLGAPAVQKHLKTGKGSPSGIYDKDGNLAAAYAALSKGFTAEQLRKIEQMMKDNAASADDVDGIESSDEDIQSFSDDNCARKTSRPAPHEHGRDEDTPTQPSSVARCLFIREPSRDGLLSSPDAPAPIARPAPTTVAPVFMNPTARRVEIAAASAKHSKSAAAPKLKSSERRKGGKAGTGPVEEPAPERGGKMQEVLEVIDAIHFEIRSRIEGTPDGILDDARSAARALMREAADVMQDCVEDTASVVAHIRTHAEKINAHFGVSQKAFAKLQKHDEKTARAIKQGRGISEGMRHVPREFLVKLSGE